MKYQVKVFIRMHLLCLQDDINNFLSSLDNTNLFEVDIKYCIHESMHHAILLYTTINNSKCDEKS